MRKQAVWVGVLWALGALCARAQSGVAALSPVEAKMVAAIDAEAPEAQSFLQALVEQNSGTMNLEGVRAVGRMLTPRFERLGFAVRWVPMDAVHRAGHLVATHPCPRAGGCGKRMLLIGHMDTVFEPASPFQHWSVSGTTATGPGVNDMKGGLVVMLMALDAMQTAGVLRDTDITVVLSGDEEAHGEPASISRRDMIEAAHHADVALEFEDYAERDGVYYASTARRSASSWTLTTTGKTGHSSGIFSEGMGYGAIYEMARILDGFRRELPEKYLTYNVGTVAGGARVEDGAAAGSVIASGKTNIVPAVARAQGDMRTISDEQTRSTQAKMQAIVAQHLPGTGAEIVFHEGYPAMPPTEANRAVLRTLNEANRALGQPAMTELDPLQRGAGDISFVAPIIPGLAGVGATGKGGHAPGESMDLPSQTLNAKRDALLMWRLSRSR